MQDASNGATKHKADKAWTSFFNNAATGMAHMILAKEIEKGNNWGPKDFFLHHRSQEMAPLLLGEFKKIRKATKRIADNADALIREAVADLRFEVAEEQVAIKEAAE